MITIRAATLVGASMLGLATPALAQSEASQPADVTGGNQDVIPDGEPEAAIEQNDASTIVVEARRRGESAQDVPLVVNAVTAEKINELNLRDFRDIQTVVPGLSLANNSNGVGSTSSVRGVNFDVNASGAFGTIEYYLNDSPMTSGAIFQAMYDIGQIEVLRGPQGTLRGKASPSGAITIAHRKPDLDEVGGYVLATVNDIGGINVNGAVGTPIIPGKLAIRLAGLVDRGRGSRVRSINNPNVNPYTRNKSARVFLRAEPTDWLNAEAVYQRIETESRGFDQVACFNQFTAAAPACAVRIDPDDRLGIKPEAQETEQEFNVFTWKASAGLAGQRLFYNGQYTEQNVRNFTPGDDANVIPVAFCGTCNENDSTFQVHEVRLQSDGRIAGLFDYVVGYFNFKQDTPSNLVNGTALNTAGTSFRFSPTLRPNDVKEESYFANLTVHLGERTEISGGARRIKIDQDSRIISVVPAGCTPNAAFGPQCPGGLRFLSPTGIQALLLAPGSVFAEQILPGAINPQTFKKTIFSASAKHRFSDDLMVYANFGTSFRPGNNVVRLPAQLPALASLTEARFLFLPAETSKSYEVGLKSEFFDDTVKLNVAAYQQDFKNYPFRAASGTPAIRYSSLTAFEVQTVNFVAPVPVRVRGFEAELEWRPSDRVNMTANVSYALGKIRNGVVPCLDLDGDGVPDRAPPAGGLQATQLRAAVGAANVDICTVNFRSSNAPPWGANLQAEYSLPMFSDRAEGFVRGLASYNGSSRNDEQNFFDDYNSRTLVNLYAGVRDPDGVWEVTLYGKNIFEDDTVLATSNGLLTTTVAPLGQAAQTIVNPGGYIGLGNPSTPGIVAPREFGVTARFAFGSR